MTRSKIFLLSVVVALFGLFAAPAIAQDQTLEVDPPSVDAPGEQTFTVTGGGFTLSPIFILPGVAPESCDIADFDATTVDTGALTPATPDADGNFTAEVTYDVPAGGIAIIAGEASQTESAAVIVCVGDPAADDAGEDDGEDTAAEDDGEDETLADTGVESGVLAIVGGAVLAAGAMVVGTSRRNR